MHTPTFSKKYFTRFFSGLFFFTACSLIPLHAQQATDPTTPIDPIDQEFSGPLAVIPDLVTVGDPGNPADPATGLGAVEDTFEIGKYPVTQLQWSTFLNAVCVTADNPLDPRGLYHPEMFSSDNPTSHLTAVSAIYKTTETTNLVMKIYEDALTVFFPQTWGTPTGHDFGALPITGITVDDCKRYANWLHNGAPSFKQFDDTTLAATESGAYDFTNGKKGDLLPGARYFIPSLNQWYKVAYHKAGSPSAGYWKYPTQGDVLPSETLSGTLFSNDHRPKTGANFATVASTWPHLKSYYREQVRGMPLTTPVGAFKDSPGPYGTFDMGGNVREWTGDSLTDTAAHCPELANFLFFAPGGSYDETSDQLLSTNSNKVFSPTTGRSIIGFRIAAKEGVCDTPTQLDAGISTPSYNNPHFDPKLFQQNLYNISFAQITSYGLEAAIKTGLAITGLTPGSTGTFPGLSDIIVSFTYQRNFVNAILSVALATSSTGEVNLMNIKKVDYWNAGLVAAATVATMAFTEGSAFIVEAGVGEVLAALKNAGWIDLTVRNSIQTLAWPRILTNGWYIGSNTYLTTESALNGVNNAYLITQSDVDYFNAQQKLLKQQQTQNANSN